MRNKKAIKAQSFQDIKVGQVIKSVKASAKITMHTKGIFTETEIEMFLRHFATKCKVIGIDSKNKRIKVQFPDGTTDFIKWVEFIIYILPKIQAIWWMIKSIFTKKK